jgi:hypothetical protein
VLEEWFALSRVEVKRVKHLAGPFYALRYHRPKDPPNKQRCLLVDVSRQYKGSGDVQDRFWLSIGLSGAPEQRICDF